MSLQWNFIAGFLYFEIIIVIVMMLPTANPRRWRQFFNSRLFSVIREKTGFYFYVLLGFLALFLIDAIREMRKYSHSHDTSNLHFTNEMKGNVKLFRAQRNFYITGFAIFLAFVIRRLVTMIFIQAELLDKSEKIIKEAENAKNLAKQTVLSHNIGSAGDAEDINRLQNELRSTKALLKEQQDKCKIIQLELETIKNVKVE